MPLYEYRCDCGHAYEEVRQHERRESVCPACFRSVWPAPSFRGALSGLSSPGSHTQPRAREGLPMVRRGD
jgi:hypothetical protein